MSMNRLPVRAVLVAVAFSALLSDALSQPDQKKRRAAADAEGQPLRRAVPGSVKVERDKVYARYGERELKLDLYLPKQPASPRIPCIVVVHGGGWRSGDKMRFAHIAGALAKRGTIPLALQRFYPAAALFPMHSGNAFPRAASAFPCFLTIPRH